MKPVVFFDMDGVLADFVTGACRAHKSTLHLEPMTVQWDFGKQIGFPEGVKNPAFWEPMGHTFWANLPILHDGRRLLIAAETLVPTDQIAILTSPSFNVGGIDGKREWVETHVPQLRSRFFTGSAKHLVAGYGKILLDDYEGNIDTWEAAGGRGILIPRSWNRRRDRCDNAGHFDPNQLTIELESAIHELESA